MNKSELLKKYFHGQCQPEEIAYLLHHLQPEDVENYQEVIKDLWDEFSDYPELESSVSERMYRQILVKGKILSPYTEGEQPIRKERKLFLFQRLAAVLVGLLVLTGISIFTLINYSMTEYSTVYGEKKVIVLPDSSVVTLNANSSIAYHEEDFGGNSREVWMEGEAYFDIRKRTVGTEKAKFIVHTEDLKVEVLGTRFNVNSRRAKTEVVLETGKVRLRVEKAGKDILMQPGDLVTYSRKHNELEHKIVLPQEYSNWRNNKFFFNGATLEHIAHEIEDHFGYKVVLKDPNLKSKQYRGTFPSDNLDILLNSLSKSFDLEVVKENGIIILKESAPATN